MASIIDIGREFDKASKSLKARNVLLRKVLICAYRYIKENTDETERMAKLFEQLKRRCSSGTTSPDGACCHELVPSSVSRAVCEVNSRQDVSLVPDSHPPNLDEQGDEAGCPADIAYVSDSASSSSSSPCTACPQLNGVLPSPALHVPSAPRLAGTSGSMQQLGVGVSDAMVASSPVFAPMKLIDSDSSSSPDATYCEPPASPLKKSGGGVSLLSTREVNEEEERIHVLLPASRLRLRRQCDTAAAAAAASWSDAALAADRPLSSAAPPCTADLAAGTRRRVPASFVAAEINCSSCPRDVAEYPNEEETRAESRPEYLADAATRGDTERCGPVAMAAVAMTDCAAVPAVIGFETCVELPADDDDDNAAAAEYEAASPAVVAAAAASRSACSAGHRSSSVHRRSRRPKYVNSSTAVDGMLPPGGTSPPLPAAASGAVRGGDGERQCDGGGPRYAEVSVKLEPPEGGCQRECSFASVTAAATGVEQHTPRGKKRKQSKIDRFFDNGFRAAVSGDGGFRCKRRDGSCADGGHSGAGKAPHYRSGSAKENVPPSTPPSTAVQTASAVVGTFDPDETTLNSPGMNRAKEADAFERVRITSTPPTKASHNDWHITPSSGKASVRVPRHRLHLNRRLNPQSTDKPAYAYAEVVRGKKRQKLKGYSCRQCNEYYGAMNLPEDERLRRLDQVCRHRGQKQPPATPSGFWDLHLD